MTSSMIILNPPDNYYCTDKGVRSDASMGAGCGRQGSCITVQLGAVVNWLTHKPIGLLFVCQLANVRVKNVFCYRLHRFRYMAHLFPGLGG